MELDNHLVADVADEGQEQNLLEYDGSLDDRYYQEPTEEVAEATEQEQEPAAEAQPTLTAEELAAVREKLFTDRQAQMKSVEQEHQRRLAELAAQEQAAIARAQAFQAAQPKQELTEFDRAVQEAVNARLAQTVTPQMQQIQQQMAQQAQSSAIQATLGAGLNDPSMPNFDQISGLAISHFGRDVVMRKIMSDTPQNAAKWMYQLGLTEAKAIPMTQPKVNPVPVQQVPVKQKAQLPRGMNVQGGAQGMSDADWQSLDKKIDNMSFEQLTEFKKNPKNMELFQRMLTYGTTNPSAARRQN